MWKKAIVALLILNEIRGAIFAAGAIKLLWNYYFP